MAILSNARCRCPASAQLISRRAVPLGRLLEVDTSWAVLVHVDQSRLMTPGWASVDWLIGRWMRSAVGARDERNWLKCVSNSRWSTQKYPMRSRLRGLIECKSAIGLTRTLPARGDAHAGHSAT